MELVNVIYPIFKRQQNGAVQLSILHETLICITENNKNALLIDDGDRTVVHDMILLMTFGQMRRNLFRPEFLKRLGSIMEAILKPRVIELCPGLTVIMKRLISYIKKDCLEFSMSELTRVFSKLLKTSTRLEFTPAEPHKVTVEKAMEFPLRVIDLLQQWYELKGSVNHLSQKQRALPIYLLVI
jgi:hypothetical protein